MARKAFVADDEMREKVAYLAGMGVPQDDIAKLIGCAAKTLRKWFRDELDRGVAEANATMAGYLFAAGKAGNVTAMIFWLKSRAKWRERGVDAKTPENPAALASPVRLVFPDNAGFSTTDVHDAREGFRSLLDTIRDRLLHAQPGRAAGVGDGRRAGDGSAEVES